MPSSSRDQSSRDQASRDQSGPDDRSFELDPSLLMTEVYSYPFPEVRAVLNSLALDERFMLNTISVDAAQELLISFGLEPKLALTGRPDGTLDLDELHVPVLDRIRDVLRPRLTGIDTYTYRYPVAGSSPAIFNVLAEWKAHDRFDRIAMRAGDYEGYRALADSLRIDVVTYPELPTEATDERELWFVSNPNARLGNWIDADEWNAFVSIGQPIVVDAAYVGLTADDVSLDVRAPNIWAVLTSPSKIFGVFRHRYTGTTFTREPVQSLYGTKWFKDIRALLDTLVLYERFANNAIPKQYKSWQNSIAAELESVIDAPVATSDTILLAHSTSALDSRWHHHQRANAYRFGLTKLFEDYERQLAG